MKKMAFFILIVLFLSGCTSSNSITNKTIIKSNPRNSSPTKPVNTDAKNTESQNFIQSLEDVGYTVIKEETGDWTFLSVYPTYYTVDSQRLAIYEYQNEEEAIKEAQGISKNGFGMISWVDKPHFYRKGEIIVSYIGSDTKLIIDLPKILGKSITINY
ncbi:MAG: hypothetical protein K0R71_746 [Bacillales bacterium]|nr:hypothetical protein [Bacillales bacterium]